MDARDGLLKLSPSRSVRRAAGAAGAGVVIKRFAGSGSLAAWKDARRARREFEMLEWLHGAGLAVPRPLALERVEGGYEVRMQEIPGAISLEQCLRGGGAWPGPQLDAHALARRLGVLLARLHGLGVAHPDLHAGNALLDERGELFAIDFHAARRVVWNPSRLRAQWIALEATSRELLPRACRARTLAAWRAHVEPSLRSCLERALEPRRGLDWLQAARDLRRRTVQKRRWRWLRDSSSCRLVDEGERRGVMSRALGDRSWSELEALLAAATARERTPGEPAWLEPDGRLRARPWLWRRAQRVRDVLPSWFACARANEHGLAACRPLALSVAPRVWALFEAAPAAGALVGAAHGDRAQRWGRWAGAFHERGLRPVWQAGASWFDAARPHLLLPLADLEFDARGAEEARAQWLALLARSELVGSHWSRSERVRFALAFGAAATGVGARDLELDDG